MKFLTWLAITFVCYVCLSSLSAAPGDLTGPGKLIANYGGSEDGCFCITRQSDGKILLAGYSRSNLIISRVMVVRLNADGSLDSTFNGSGKVFVTSGQAAVAQAIHVLADGKILVAGSTYDAPDPQAPTQRDYAALVMRFNADGSLDTSFDGDGKVTTFLPGKDILGRCIAVQEDGKVVVGCDIDLFVGRYAAVRYEAGGALDTTFGSGGIALGPQTGGPPSKIVIQPDGKIVLGGKFWLSSAAGMIRFTSQGALDTTFSGDGMASQPWSVGVDANVGMIRLADGKFMLAGVSQDGKVMLFRFTSAGAPDTTFDSDGIRVFESPILDDLEALQSLPGGGFAVCGHGNPGAGAADFFVMCFTAEGLLDGAFNTTGVVGVDFSGGEDLAFGLVADASGGLFVAGAATGYTGADAALVKLTATGAADPGFGSGGKVVLNAGTGSTPAYAAAVQADGKIVVAGQDHLQNLSLQNFSACVARHLPGGALDAGFGQGGVVFTTLLSTARAVLVLPDGRLLVAGDANARAPEQGTKMVVMRLLEDGRLDSTFAGVGHVSVHIAQKSADIAYTLALQSDGKILVGGGSTAPAESSNAVLLRFNEDGTPDNSFSGDGTLVLNDGVIKDLALQPDGRILAAGEAGSWTLFRLLADGGTDGSFGQGGGVATFSGPFLCETHALSLLADGRITTIGTLRVSTSNTKSDACVVRYLPDGSLDTSFNTSGLVTGFWRGDDIEVSTLADNLIVQGSGRIIVGCSVLSASANRSDFTLARLMPDGTFDPGFGGGGKSLYQMSESRATRSDIRLLGVIASGQMIACGSLVGREGNAGMIWVDVGAERDIAVFAGAPATGGSPLVNGEAAHDFGPRAIASTTPVSFTVKNLGESDLTGLSGSLAGAHAGDFTLSPPLPDKLAAGQTATITATFAPAAEGPREAVMTIASNDPDEGAFEVHLDGSGFTDNKVEFESSAHLFREEAGVVQIPVIRPAGSSGIVKVQLQYVNGTAKSGADFTTTLTEAVFGPGVNQVDIPVTLLNPLKTPEPVESFTINLVQPSDGAVLGTRTTAAITLFDSADAKPPVVALKTPAANARFLEAAGPSVSITGTARSNKGVQRVQVRLNDGAYQDAVLTPDAKAGPGGVGFTLVVDAAPGPNVVYVRAADRRGDESAPLTRTFTWVLMRPLQVGASGPGTVSAGFVPTSLREVGKRYTITARPKAGGPVFKGWTETGAGISEAELEVPGLSFIFRENMTLAAGFGDNPFVGLDGVYTGLLQASRTTPHPSGTAASHQSEGLLTVAVQRTGAFTAKVLSGGQSYSWPGTFTHDGKGRFGARRDPHAYLARKNLPLLRFDLRLNVAGQPGISGIAGDGREVVPAAGGAGGYDLMGDAAFDLQADQAYYNGTARIVPAAYLGDKNASGLFTAFFPVATPAMLPANAFPPGEGLATLNLTKSGAASLAGVLADGTAFTCSAPLSQTLRWSVYAPLYTGKLGSLSGWARLDHTQDDSDFSASGLRWFRPADAKAQHYPSGWSGGLLVDLLGARHRVEPGKSVFPDLEPSGPDGNLHLVCNEGWLFSTMLRPLNLSPSDVVTKVGLNAADYTLTVTRASGRYAGTFTHNLGGSSRQAFQGIIYQKGAHRGGHGFFLSPTPKVKDGLGAGGHARLVLPQ